MLLFWRTATAIAAVWFLLLGNVTSAVLSALAVPLFSRRPSPTQAYTTIGLCAAAAFFGVLDL